jgi:hypothetical protein
MRGRFRAGLLLFSAAFLLIGLAPYRWAAGRKVSRPDELIVSPQECGCPCPDARIKAGKAVIPPALISPCGRISEREVNLVFKEKGPFSNYELMYRDLLLRGRVISLDTEFCTETYCELVPRLEVSHWDVVPFVANFRIFPLWLVIVYVANLFLFLPLLLILVVVGWYNVRGRRSAKV